MPALPPSPASRPSRAAVSTCSPRLQARIEEVQAALRKSGRCAGLGRWSGGLLQGRGLRALFVVLPVAAGSCRLWPASHCSTLLPLTDPPTFFTHPCKPAEPMPLEAYEFKHEPK